MRSIYLLSLLILVEACSHGSGLPDKPVGKVSSAELIEGFVESFDGVPIAYTRSGSEQITLVFIHGWACNRGHWGEQVAHFADRHAIITLDLAGHGDSGDQRDEWTLNSLGRDVVAVIEEAGPGNVVLIGHSMGGPVALETALLIPERVLGIIGVDTFHDADFEYDMTEWEALMEAYERDFDATCRQFVDSMFLESSDPVLVARIRTEMCEIEPEIATTLLGIYPGYDVAAAMGRVQAPVRSVNASVFPTNIEGNRRYSPGFDAVIMEDVSHFPMIERPADFNPALRTMIEAVLAESGR